MDDARFSQSQGPSTGGGSGFDYFGAPPTAQPSAGASGYAPPAPPPFGVPAQGQPGGQFGAPAGYSGPPAPPPPAQRGHTLSRGVKAVIVLVGLLVVIGGIRLWNVHQHARPIVLPATFNGQLPNTSPAAESVKTGLVTEMQSHNPGLGVNAEIYGDNQAFTMLGAARGHLDVQQDLTNSEDTAPAAVGDAWCVTALDHTYVACERSGLSLTVFVLVRGDATTDATAALVDSAYAQF